MDRILAALLAALLIPAAGLARAAAEPVELVLEDQRQHGFTSPTRAIARLQAAAPALGPQTPVAVRMRYHAALAWFAISNDDATLVQTSLRQLEHLAADAGCGPCQLYARVRDAQWAIRRRDTARARALFVAIDAMPEPADPDVRFAIDYTRAMLADTTGEHARAVEHAVRAGRIAASNGDPANQVRALNVLALANAGNGDLDQAEAVALEAYAIAERIGFRYMMAYLRGNLGHIYSGKGDLDKQYVALTDALRIASGEPGLGELELMHRVNLAEHHNQRGQYGRAVEQGLRAAELARGQNNALGESAALNSVAASRLGLGQPQAAIETLKRAIANSERIDAKSYLTASLQLLAQAYERTGRSADTIATLRRIIEIDAKANEQTRAKAAAEAQQQFAAERKDREIERLSLENAKRQAEVAAQTWQRRLWAALAVALALGGALLVQVVRRVRSANRSLQVDNELLARESVHDPLTGAYNRRHCQQLMGQHEAQLRKSEGRDYAAGVGLMVLDIDFFKKINDRYGHGVGDKVLVEVSGRLRALVR